MKYAIQTFGCQMNYSDSERVSSVLERLGYNVEEDFKLGTSNVDVLVFNTCSVRQKAEDRVYGLRKTLKAHRKQNPKMVIVITGCMIKKTSRQASEAEKIQMEAAKKIHKNRAHENEPKDPILSVMPEVDIALRIEDIAELPALIKALRPDLQFEDTPDEGTLENYFKIAPKKATGYSVFVPIGRGCDKFCTYCIVPFTRGREASRDFKEIVEECERHVADGAIEITLVGQTVNSYGLSFGDRKDGKFKEWTDQGRSPFAALLRAVDELKEKGLRRLRFTSPHPRDFSDELIETLASLETICPYIHMPVQAGDDRTLRRMNRNYLTEEYKTIMRKIKAAMPGCAISTDIIVGFCGETEEEFENTLAMYKEMEWDMCYLAKYSPRKGTYSERNLPDDVPLEVKTERWHRLNNLLKEVAAQKHRAFVGKTVEVLVTQQIGETCTGRTREFKEIQFRSGRPLVGKLAQVHVDDADIFYLKGSLA